MSYEIRFKERVLSRLETGISQREAARVFGISRNTFTDWLAYRNSGERLVPRKRAGKPRKIKPGRLHAIIRKTPDVYGCEIAAELGCSRSAVCYALRRHGYTLKKNAAFRERDEKQAKPSSQPSPAPRRKSSRMWTRQG